MFVGVGHRLLLAKWCAEQQPVTGRTITGSTLSSSSQMGSNEGWLIGSGGGSGVVFSSNEVAAAHGASHISGCSNRIPWGKIYWQILVEHLSVLYCRYAMTLCGY